MNFNETIRNKNVHHLESLKLRKYADIFHDQPSEQSNYVEVSGVKRRKVIKKTSLVWLLRSDSSKLSSDRLYGERARYPQKKKDNSKKDTVC